MKRILFSFVLISSISLCLTACSTRRTHINGVIETGIIVESQPFTSCYELSEGILNLVIDPTDDGMQFTQYAVKTNSTQITASVEHINDTSEITVYLFRSEDLENYFATTTLSSQKKEVHFSPLTYAEAYFIGVEAHNLDEELVLKISE